MRTRGTTRGSNGEVCCGVLIAMAVVMFAFWAHNAWMWSTIDRRDDADASFVDVVDSDELHDESGAGVAVDCKDVGRE